MANTSSLWIAASGLQNAQNAVNVTANNLANVDTPGYVRQQVLFQDTKYRNIADTAAISKQLGGLGVSIADVIHNRDVFLDLSYRVETGRQIFYSMNYEVTKEVENYFQELNGKAFREIMSGDTSIWVAFQEFAKDPSTSVQQTLVLQKASLFVSNAQDINKQLKEYQQGLNVQIRDDVNRINELGNTIRDLNLQIQKIESGGQETAMTLRDQRDLALDELGKLARIDYKERADGSVRVWLEAEEFVTEVDVYEIELTEDEDTGYYIPTWPQLKNQEVFDLTAEIASEFNSDVGKVKALLLARGDHPADYRDITKYYDGVSTFENANGQIVKYSDLTQTQKSYMYQKSVGDSIVMNSMAEFDNLVHAVVTAMNDLFSPLTKTEVNNGTVTFMDANGNEMYTGVIGGNTITTADGPVTLTDANGNAVNITATTRFLDTNTAPMGSDKQLPPRELFTRVGCERYTELQGSDGNTYYMYNEEDLTDTSKMYTIGSIRLNEEIKDDSSLIPFLSQNGEVDYGMGDRISKAWSTSNMQLNPSHTGTWNFSEYYEQLIGELGSNGEIFRTTSEDLEQTVATIESRRSSVIGVSSDEELTNIIRFQNAYNASSRFFNVVSEMMEYLLSSL